jgi:hypothetical protein
MKDAGTQTHTRDEDFHGEPRRDLDETVRLGLEIYERDIRHKVEKDHVGKIVAIDVDSGCWALGDANVVPDEEVAVERLREQRPEATDILLERVGYRALRSFGAGSLRIRE